MKLSGEAQAELIKVALIGVAVVGAVWYLKRQVTGAAQDAIQWVDDLDMSDTFVSNWEKAGEAVPFSVMWWSGKAVDAYHAAPAVLPKINPASDQNVVYQGANWLGSKVTGDEGFNLGGWLYDVTH
jgi:hypothetical protein